MPVCHRAGVLRWRLFKCLLRLAHDIKVFSGDSLTLHEVKGHAGVCSTLLLAFCGDCCGLAVGAEGCGFGWFIGSVVSFCGRLIQRLWRRRFEWGVYFFVAVHVWIFFTHIVHFGRREVVVFANEHFVSLADKV